MTMPLYFHSYLFASSEERVEKSLSVVINIFHKQFFSVGFSNTRFIVLTCSKYLLDFQKMKQTELPWETKKRPGERNRINSSYHTTTLCINEHCVRMTLQLGKLKFNFIFFFIFHLLEKEQWGLQTEF